MNPLILILASWCAAGLFLVGGWWFNAWKESRRNGDWWLHAENKRLRERLAKAEREIQRLSAVAVIRPARPPRLTHWTLLGVVPAIAAVVTMEVVGVWKFATLPFAFAVTLGCFLEDERNKRGSAS